MQSLIRSCLAVGLLLGLYHWAVADDAKDASAVIKKAVQALGGGKKLGASKGLTWKTKGKISIGGNENEFSSKTTIQGLGHFRQEFEGEFGGNPVKGVTILSDDQGWRKFGDEARKLEEEALKNQKRMVYLQVVALFPSQLNEKNGFKIESVEDGKAGDKAASVVKATGPEGKDFQIFFDKQTGLPIKTMAKVAGRNNEEFTQETVYSNYKEIDGIKRATKVEIKRNEETFMHQELTDFKVLDKVDPMTFAEPQ